MSVSNVVKIQPFKVATLTANQLTVDATLRAFPQPTEKITVNYSLSNVPDGTVAQPAPYQGSVNLNITLDYASLNWTSQDAVSESIIDEVIAAIGAVKA